MAALLKMLFGGKYGVPREQAPKLPKEGVVINGVLLKPTRRAKFMIGLPGGKLTKKGG